MNPVQKVKIIETRKLYKDTVEANSIELAFNNVNAFGVVVAKSQEALGKEGIYIQPDFCLPSDLEAPIFDSYIAPDGNPNKSRLGKQNRIRAIKFNFSLENYIDPVFSMGIFLTKEIFLSYFPNINFETITEEELTQLLKITKYEEPEKAFSGMTKGELPLGMYSTDETNSANLVSHINKVLPHECYGTIKSDGSSITLYYKSEEENGICSRNQEKKLSATQITGYTDLNGNLYTKYWNAELQQRGWKNSETEIFVTDEEIQNFELYTPIEEELKDVDTWVKLGLPILERFKKLCKENNFVGALRGELVGTGLKGSGNKNNPHSKLPQQILFFGLDDYSTGATVRVPLDTLKIKQLELELDIKWNEIIFESIFSSYEEIEKYCQEYFKTNMVEGIVVRTTNDNGFSAKFMNPAYDAAK